MACGAAAKEGTETHSSILAWRILWTEGFGHRVAELTEVT